jgi:hypothetical protein
LDRSMRRRARSRPLADRSRTFTLRTRRPRLSLCFEETHDEGEDRR